jgi:hypothetical protein
MSLPLPGTPTLTLLVLLPLLGWRVYSRVRRMVGRQRLSGVRPWITLVVFPLILLLLAWDAAAHPGRLAVSAVGVALGVVLGHVGLARTRFEATPQALYYTPNAHLGIALSLLFIGRIVYRVLEVTVFAPHLPHGMDDFARSPLTLAVFGLMAGYYVRYAIGLLRWRRSVVASNPPR